MSKISSHEPEEANPAHIHVLPVVVLLPLSATLTPLLTHHLYLHRITSQMMQGMNTSRKREDSSGLSLLAFSGECEADNLFSLMLTRGSVFMR